MILRSPSSAYSIFLVIFFHFFRTSSLNITTNWRTVTFCSVSNPDVDDRTPQYHKRVQSHNASNIKFIYSSDRYTCLELLLNRTVDFAVFRPEDLFVASVIENSGSSDDLRVSHEFRPQWCRRYEFDMTVLVSNALHVVDTFADFNGKLVCYPGSNEYGWLFDFSNRFLQTFAQPSFSGDCDPKMTSYENKLRKLSSTFGSSCLPGPWTPSPTVDNILKTKYPSLCSLCPRSCTTNDEYWSPRGTFSCIGNCKGEISWLKWHDVLNFYRSSPICSNVSLFCPNQGRQKYNNFRTCTWISRPRPIVVSHKAASQDIEKLISHINLSENTQKSSEWEYRFRKILLKSTDDFLFHVGPVSLESYLNTINGFRSAKSVQSCESLKKSAKLCFEDENDVKICNSLRRVTKVYSIDPQIECLQRHNCKIALENDEVDALVSSSDNLKEIFESSKFKVSLYQTSAINSGNLLEFSAVVKSDANISSLSDLRNKRACFPKRNGFAWNSFLITLRNFSLVNEYRCFGDYVFREFFNEVCVADPNENIFNKCFQGTENIYSDERQKTEVEALRCLIENKGDVAFINYAMIEQYLDDNREKRWTDDFITDDFKTVCPEKFRFQQNGRCILSFGSPRKVLIRKSLSEWQEQQIIFPILISTSFLISKVIIEEDAQQNSGTDFSLFKLPKYNGKEAMIVNDEAYTMEFQDSIMYRSQFKSLAYELELEKMLQNCVGAVPPPNLSSSKMTVPNYLFLLLFTVSLVFSKSSHFP